MRKEFNKDYYLGLDIGTESIGWAVTDEDYNILKFNKKAMWGIRLFDEAKTAEERRLFRSIRRRGQRKAQRIKLLQEIFAEEMAKVDIDFFQRLKDSKFLPEDKRIEQIYSLFGDEDYCDRHFYKEYATIYHLRKELITNGQEHDIRLVYLALHHIIKNRGHFLFEGDLKSATDFNKLFINFVDMIYNELEIEISKNNIEQIEKLLKDKGVNKSTKKNNLRELLEINKSDKKGMTLLSLMVGLKGNLKDLFPQEPAIDSMEKHSICYADASYEDTRASLEQEIPEQCFMIDSIKSIYDWAILSDILSGGEYEGNMYLSVAKVRKFEKHKQDLEMLKHVVRKYLSQEEYHKIFNAVDEKNNYANYVGHAVKSGKKRSLKRCQKDEFYKYIKDKLKIINADDDKELIQILSSLEEDTFLPLQVTKDNGVIPQQVHKSELVAIMEHAKGYLPFLSDKDSDGFTKCEKIEKIFDFRIPYYVGPINDSHRDKNANCWFVRKEEGAIRPWNISQKIDMDASAVEFIERMTNKCTYLVGEDVLPKHSLLYSEFMVLNELNNLRIKGEKIENNLKLKIYEDLFKTRSRVTGKMLREYLKSEGYDEITSDELSGFDKDFKSALTSYLDFKKKVFKGMEERMEEASVREMVEDIIRWICVYGDDKKMLKRVIEKKYPNKLTSEQIKAACNLRYTGWGRLSRELLQDIEGVNKETGEIFSIIGALRETTDNFMQILSVKYTFKEEIDEQNANNQEKIQRITYESTVKDLYVSPSIKRAIWQVITITEEVRKIMGRQPKKIFVEMARGGKNEKKGDAGRKQSRKDKFLELYKNIKDEGIDWKSELENTPEDRFRSIKLYLYYTQMGKCMYSGKRIELSELANTNIYDKDHIYPRSKTKDDSLDNLILVKKELNANKGNGIITAEIQNKMRTFWMELLRLNFISKEKYNRLTRTTPLTSEELAGFINRQLVEARQSSKAVAEIFKKLYGESEVVYVKSETVTDFRRDYNFVKVRSINDYHHAKDAYLNIVVGNVYHEKFTSNPLNWLKGHSNDEYSLNQMFNRNLQKNEKYIWRIGNEGTIGTVKKIMSKNNIQYTRYATCNKGGFFDQQIVSKHSNPTVPIKAGMDPLKYGGYKSVTPAYFALVESEGKKGEKIRTIESVPAYLEKEFAKNPERFLEYCKENYGLTNPVVKIARIKKNALLVVNGFAMHLRGRSDERLVLQGAVQLCMDEGVHKYYKKIEKYLAKNSERSGKKDVIINEKYDGISREANIELYDKLIDKHANTIYKVRPAGQVERLVSGRDKFEKLPVEKQCIVLGEILKLFVCKPITADMRELGGSKGAGGFKMSKKVLSHESIFLINQSPTGLFEQKIDLRKV